MLIRRLLLVAALLIGVAPTGSARFLLHSGGSSGTSSGDVASITERNTGPSTTPGSTFPAQFAANFAQDAVPVGSIAVPSIGGSSIVYQNDCAAEGCPMWPAHGASPASLRQGIFSVIEPQLASTSEQTAHFTVTAGSYNTTTTVTPASLAAHDDWVMTLNHVNDSWVNTHPAAMNVPHGTYVGCYADPTTHSITSCGVQQHAPTTTSGLIGQNCSNQGAGACTGYTYLAGVATTTSSTLPNTIYFDPTASQPSLNPNCINNCVRIGSVVTDATTSGVIPSLATVALSGTGSTTSTSAGSLAGATTLTFASTPTAPQYALVVDVNTPSAITAGTYVSVTPSSGTVTISAPVTGPGVGSGDTIKFYTFVQLSANVTAGGVAQGDSVNFSYTVLGSTGTPAAISFNQTNNLVTSVNVLTPGSGYATEGSGTWVFDFNTILNEYGSTQPHQCDQVGGAATFTGTVSGTSLTSSAVTGTISLLQVVTDSATPPHTALITAGSGSSWTVANGTLVSGAMSSNEPLCIYGQGTVAAKYQLWGPYIDTTTGARHPWLYGRGTIEAWTNGTGSIVETRPVMGTTTGMVYVNSVIPSYTFDAEWTDNGTTVRGASIGSSGFNAIVQENNGIWYSVGTTANSLGPPQSGRPDWSANSDAFNNVILAFTTPDKVLFKASGAQLPLNDCLSAGPPPSNCSGTAVSVTPAILPAISLTSWGSPSTMVNTYVPYTFGGMDTNLTLSGGGNHWWFGPVPTHAIYWYESTDCSPVSSSCDRGASWLNNLRVASIAELGTFDGIREPATYNPVNVVSDTSVFSNPAFTDTVKTKFNFRGDTNVFGTVSGGAYPHSLDRSLDDPTHFVPLPPSMYVLEGERFMLDGLEGFTSGDQIHYNLTGNSGGTTLGSATTLTSLGTTYYGIFLDNSPRGMGWSWDSLRENATLSPPNEPIGKYYRFLQEENYDFQLAFIPYVGSGTVGSSLTFTKGYDLTNIGLFTSPQILSTNNIAPLTILWQDYYWHMGEEEGAMLQGVGGSTAAAAVDNIILNNYAVKNPAVNCVFNDLSYSNLWADEATQVPNANWDATNPATATRFNGYRNTTITAIGGQSEVSASLFNAGFSGNTQMTAATTGAGSAVNVTSIPGSVLIGGIIYDQTTPSAIVPPAGSSFAWITATGGTTITMSGTTTGITAGDVIQVSAKLIYPLNGANSAAIPGDSIISPINADTADEGVPNGFNIGTFPPPSTPSIVGGTHYYWCPDQNGLSVGAAAGYISTTHCGIANSTMTPIMFTGGVPVGGTSAVNQFQVGWVPNRSCPTGIPGQSSDWQGGSEIGGTQSYGLEMLATVKSDQAIRGVTADNTAAIANLAPYWPPSSLAGLPSWATSQTLTPGP